MALLYCVRDRSLGVISTPPASSVWERPRLSPGALPFLCAAFLALIGAGCRGFDAPVEFQPDSLLRVELGLTDADEVHRVMVTGGMKEVLDPAETEIPIGAWVEFVTTDWRVHVVRFETDSLGESARAFLEGSDQVASPPLVERDARFVVSFADAPAGRYPFVTEGNGSPTRGVVVVQPSR